MLHTKKRQEFVGETPSFDADLAELPGVDEKEGHGVGEMLGLAPVPVVASAYDPMGSLLEAPDFGPLSIGNDEADFRKSLENRRW